MNFKFILLSLFIFLNTVSFSSEIDSLNQITKQSINDSVNFEVYNKLIRIYLSNNIDTVPVLLLKQNKILLKNVFKESSQKQKLVDWYNNSGVYNRKKGYYDRSIRFFDKAYKIAKKIGDKSSQAIELNNIANVHYTRGDFLIAMDYHLKALALRKSLNDTAGIAMSLGNIGLIYESLNDFNKALENYEKSRGYFSMLNNKIAVAWCNRLIGVAYLDNNELNGAKKYLNESYQICKELDDYEAMKFSLINLSSVYFKEFKKTRERDKLDSINLFINEFEILQKKQPTFRTQASFLMIKAKYNYFNNNYIYANSLLDSAEAILVTLDLKNELKDLYLLKSEIFEKQNNYTQALNFYKKYKAISDTIFNLEKENEIGRKAALFEYEEQLKLEKLRHLNEEQNLKSEEQIQILFSLTVILMLILVIILFFIFYRKKQIHYNKLQREKDKLKKDFLSLESAYNEVYSNLLKIKSNKFDELQLNSNHPKWINDLSKREMEVLSCIAIGLSDKEIKDKLYISITTVRSHCRSIYRKLLVKNRVEAANLAKEYGLI